MHTHIKAKNVLTGQYENVFYCYSMESSNILIDYSSCVANGMPISL